MRLKDIMSTNIESVGSGQSLERAQKRMQARGIHHLMVTKRGRVIGIISTDRVEARLAEGAEKVEEALSHRVPAGTPDMTVSQAARLLRGRSAGALPVFDGQRLVGIVTISDLLDVLARRGSRRTPEQESTVDLSHTAVDSPRRAFIG
jgi:acetoin utilization protein AcuB